ncbi:MAG: hypothetical protein HW380_51 [Magnetococcales bacterium]|nr:hypothetical protein [Magnetococcales bacterium]
MADAHDGAIAQRNGIVEAVGRILGTTTKLALHFSDLPPVKTAVANDEMLVKQLIIRDVHIFFFPTRAVTAVSENNDTLSFFRMNGKLGMVVGFDDDFQPLVATQKNGDMPQRCVPQSEGNIRHLPRNLSGMGYKPVVKVGKGVDVRPHMGETLQPTPDFFKVGMVQMHRPGQRQRGDGKQCQKPGSEIPVVKHVRIEDGRMVDQGENPGRGGMHSRDPGSDFPVVEKPWSERGKHLIIRFWVPLTTCSADGDHGLNGFPHHGSDYTLAIDRLSSPFSIKSRIFTLARRGKMVPADRGKQMG